MAMIDDTTLPVLSARDLQRPLPLLLPGDIRDMRRLCGLSMQQLARRVGVGVMAVSAWESGANVPTRQNVQRLLDVFMQASSEAGEIRATVRRIRRRSG
jgi:DNA-binding transcriptional regulator YiaG